MPVLHIFNPEYEYALAYDSPFYQAPKSIADLRKRLELLPIIWAADEDFILLSDNKIFSIKEKRKINKRPEKIDSLTPWGWDKAIRYRLKQDGFPEELLPSFSQIETMRRLSHRRISINFNKELDSPSVPKEFQDLEEAMEFFGKTPGCYFKMPWSSGGRGVVATRELNHLQVKEWISGCLKKQGSVIAEKGIDRLLDFASLWDIRNEEAIFQGLSVSLSDGRGKYKGNVSSEQEKIWRYVASKTTADIKSLIECQRVLLNKYAAKLYSGKIGIDMIVDKKGILFPCVEINLRRTMGHAAIDFFLHPDKEYIKTLISDIPFVELKTQ